jgi:lysophospholipase
VRLHYSLYETAATRADLLIIHGAGEYGERYEDFSVFCAGKGIRVCAPDLRGYGSSGGPRAYARSFDDYGRDIEALIQKAFTPSHPLFLLGHSMGGLITAHAAAYILDPQPSGILLSSPCFGLAVKVSRISHVLSALLERVWPTFLHRTPHDPSQLTHDQAVRAACLADTRLLHRMSSGLYANLLKRIADGPNMAQRIHCPIHIAQAGADPVVQPRASRLFFDQLLSTQKSFRIYEGSLHEVLHETFRADVYEEFAAWILGRLTNIG